MLVLDLLTRQPGQASKTHVENRLRLDLAQRELLHQAGACRIGVGGSSDQRDDRVDVVERDEVALENVGAGFGLAQFELRPARDHFALEVEVVANELEQRQRLGHAADQRDGVVAERALKRRVLEQLVQRDLRDRIALQLDVDAHAVLVGMVLQGVVAERDLGQHLALDEIGDLLDHAALPALANAIRQGGDDDCVLAAAQLLDVGARAHDDAAASGAVRVTDPGTAYDVAAGREIRAVDVLHQALDVDVRLLDHCHDGIDHLAEMVRWHVRGHTDSDAGRAVDKEIREARRQDARLLARLVIVRLEVDRVGVDVAE